MRILFTLLFLAVGVGMSAQQQQQQALVSVVGEGIVKVVPDMVVIQARIENEGNDVTDVKKRNDETVDNIIKYLKSVGIDSKDIKTTYVNLNKNYDFPTGKGTIFSNQSISITIRNIKNYEKIVQGLLNNGLNRIDGINFQSSQIDKHKEEARRKAVLNAREKANFYATSLGQNIGPAFLITEVESNNFQPMYRMEAMQSQSDMGESETLAPGEMEVSVKVNVAFHLKIKF